MGKDEETDLCLSALIRKLYNVFCRYLAPPALSAAGRFAQDAKGAKFTENFFLFLFAEKDEKE